MTFGQDTGGDEEIEEPCIPVYVFIRNLFLSWVVVTILTLTKTDVNFGPQGP